MKEIYTLNSDPLPWPPVPHDCLITDIRIQDRVLEFTFEEDISCHDSIKVLKPGAKSLVMRFNLCGDPYDQENLLIRLESAVKLRWWNPWKPFSPIQRCRILDNKKLPGRASPGIYRPLHQPVLRHPDRQAERHRGNPDGNVRGCHRV